MAVTPEVSTLTSNPKPQRPRSWVQWVGNHYRTFSGTINSAISSPNRHATFNVRHVTLAYRGEYQKRSLSSIKDSTHGPSFLLERSDLHTKPDDRPFTMAPHLDSPPPSPNSFSQPRPRPLRSPGHSALIRAQNRRRAYLERHSSYFQSSEHELAGESSYALHSSLFVNSPLMRYLSAFALHFILHFPSTFIPLKSLVLFIEEISCLTI